jgi:predicted nucleotide-binding protein (sugar kinase/HSP70/actin superfamily)
VQEVAGNVRVGIPRGLFWYYAPDLYKVFWEALGFEVVQSPATNRDIFEEGLKLAHDELCVPVKIFHGHVAYLRDKVDFIFIPRVISAVKKGKKRYGCPKFIGLPELIENSVPSLPRIVSADINLAEASLKDAFMGLRRTLKLKKSEIKHAVERMVNFENTNRPFGRSQDRNGSLRIGVIGHPYVLYDPYLSLNLLQKLTALGVDYTTSSEVPETVIESHLEPEIDLYWIYERDLVGAASFFANNGDFDGGLHCVSFGCGPGSVMMEMIGRKIVKGKEFPFFSLVMDESTGETGLLTRLEAFCDMIRINRK